MIRKIRVWLASRKLEKLVRKQRKVEAMYLQRRLAAKRGWQTRRAA